MNALISKHRAFALMLVDQLPVPSFTLQLVHPLDHRLMLLLLLLLL